MTEPRSGVVLQGVDPPGEFCGMVEEIESLGFNHLWLTDSSLHARNCYAYLTLASVASSQLLLGTAVTNPATPPPGDTAWFPQTAPHICDLAGLSPEIVTRVREAYQGGEFQEAAVAARQLPDSFVRKVALAGNGKRAMGQIRAVLDAGADSVHVFPIGSGRMNTVRSFADAWRSVMAELQAKERNPAARISHIEENIS